MKNLRINTIGKMVSISSDNFNFCYDKEMSNCPIANDVTNIYSYMGGLQCNYKEDTDEYKKLHNRLCELANYILVKNLWLNTL